MNFKNLFRKKSDVYLIDNQSITPPPPGGDKSSNHVAWLKKCLIGQSRWVDTYDRLSDYCPNLRKSLRSHH